MAVNDITVNTYNPPKGLDKSNVIISAVSFNKNINESYCKKYIGTNKSNGRRLIKKIFSGLEGIIYTINFSFDKASSEDANISYILSEGDNIIIESNQSYSTTSEFDTDIEYIILQIEKIFM